MAGKKVKSEVESIRTELNELTEAIYALREHVTIESAASAAASRSRSSHARHPVAGSHGDGEITSSGYMKLATQEGQPATFQWEAAAIPVKIVLNQDLDPLARLLAAIGHRQRLAILKALLDKSRSAAELVDDLQLGTTGAAYHHLNVLQAVDLVIQEDRGVFSIHASKVGTLLTIMASMSALTSLATAPDTDGSDAGSSAPKGKSKKKSGDS